MAFPISGYESLAQQIFAINADSGNLMNQALQMAALVSAGQTPDHPLLQQLEGQLGPVPRRPDNSVYTRYQELQQSLGQREAEAGEAVTQNQDEIKDSFFDEFHYEFGADGKPTVVEGKETLESKMKRLKWERDRVRTAGEGFDSSPAGRAMLDELRGLQEDLAQTRDPKVREELTRRLADAQFRYTIEKGRAQMHADLPPTDGEGRAGDLARQMHDFQDQALDDFQAVHFDNQDILANDPDGKAIAEYTEAHREYMLRANELLRQQSTFDPDTMFRAGQNLGLL
ncbi:MAG: hypothetical protein HY319_04020 [Armatimonadetes bacterium]|nr:hypothetical protein [Armatimonadota bacterium]